MKLIEDPKFQSTQMYSTNIVIPCKKEMAEEGDSPFICDPL